MPSIKKVFIVVVLVAVPAIVLQILGCPPDAGATDDKFVEYYLLGSIEYQEKLYPPVTLIDKKLGLHTYADVISHFTASSLETDNVRIEDGSLKVEKDPNRGYKVSFLVKPGYEDAGAQFAAMHKRLMDRSNAGQALNGAEFCKKTDGCWNPMSGFPVNKNDGKTKWHVYLPLGMPIVNHKSVTLLHYPPYVALTSADYLHNMTLERWTRLLKSVGIKKDEQSLYYNIVDVNPIAAPGSGQAEYPNDYFPIMMASVYFDNEEENRGYIRNMLETSLNTEKNEGEKFTLPLLVAGSPLYDPQAPGWFRVRYKEHMPKNEYGVPQMNVLQTGKVRIKQEAKKLTPYMGANHMIAAGVTGKCTDDSSKIPDIRQYESQDLVAACFLQAYGDNPNIEPDEAKKECCRKWYGNDKCSGKVNPRSDEMLIICKLAQIDLYFDDVNIKPRCGEKEAEFWCKYSTEGTFDPCIKGHGACYNTN